MDGGRRARRVSAWRYVWAAFGIQSALPHSPISAGPSDPPSGLLAAHFWAKRTGRERGRSQGPFCIARSAESKGCGSDGESEFRDCCHVNVAQYEGAPCRNAHLKKVLPASPPHLDDAASPLHSSLLGGQTVLVRGVSVIAVCASWTARGEEDAKFMHGFGLNSS